MSHFCPTFFFTKQKTKKMNNFFNVSFLSGLVATILRRTLGSPYKVQLRLPLELGRRLRRHSAAHSCEPVSHGFYQASDRRWLVLLISIAAACSDVAYRQGLGELGGPIEPLRSAERRERILRELPVEKQPLQCHPLWSFGCDDLPRSPTRPVHANER